MMASDEKVRAVRGYVLVGSLIGLAFTLIITVAGGGQASATRTAVIATLVGFPFILALASLKLPRLAHQRLLWAISAALAALVALPLIFSGIGFFVLALAAGLAWAAVTTGHRHLPFAPLLIPGSVRHWPGPCIRRPPQATRVRPNTTSVSLE